MANRPWAYIPTQVLADQERSEKADNWATEQRGIVADQWAEAHTNDFLAEAAKITNPPAPQPTGIGPGPFSNPHQDGQESQGMPEDGASAGDAFVGARAPTTPSDVKADGGMPPDQTGPSPDVPEFAPPTLLRGPGGMAMPGLPTPFQPAKPAPPSESDATAISQGEAPIKGADELIGRTAGFLGSQGASRPGSMMMAVGGEAAKVPELGGATGGLGEGLQAAGESAGAGGGDAMAAGLKQAAQLEAILKSQIASAERDLGNIQKVRSNPRAFQDTGTGMDYAQKWGRLQDLKAKLGQVLEMKGQLTGEGGTAPSPSPEPITVYHGTDSGHVFPKFREGGGFGQQILDGLGPHFGTEQAATDRLTQKQGVKTSQMSNSARVIEAQIAPTNPLLNSAGEPYAESELRNVIARIAAKAGVDKARIQKVGVVGSGVSSEPALAARRVLREQGYDAIPYINGKEDKGSVSWIVLDPAILQAKASTYLKSGRSGATEMGQIDPKFAMQAGGGVGGAAAGQIGTDENTSPEEHIARAILGAGAGLAAGRAAPAIVADLKAGGTQKWIDRGQAIRYGSMLSDWLARGADVATGVIHTAERPVETLIAGYPKAAYADVKAMVGGIPDAWAAAAHTLTTGESKFGARRDAQAAVRPFGDSLPGRVATGVTDLMATADEFVKSLNYNGALYAEAQKMGKQLGTAPDLLIEWATRKGNAAYEGPAATKLRDRAEQAAQLVTYTEDPGAIPKWLSQGRSLEGPAGVAVSLVLPFVRVGANITRRGIQRTARGFIVPGLAEAGYRALKGDPEAARQALAKTAIAAGVGAMFASEAAQGHLIGDLQDEPTKMDDLRTLGVRPNSWNVLGSGRYVDLAPLGEIGVQAIAIANGYQALKGAKAGVSPDEIASRFIGGVANGLKDSAYLTGLADTMAAAKTGRAIQQKAGQIASSLVPMGGALNRAGIATDPYERDVKGANIIEGVFNTVKGRTPGARETLPERQTVMGKPSESTNYGIRGALDPVRGGDAKPDPVVQAILDNGGQIPVAPPSVEGVKLTIEEQRRFRTLRGEELQKSVLNAVNSPRWAQRSPEIRKELMKSLVDDAGDVARAKLYRTFDRSRLTKKAS